MMASRIAAAWGVRVVRRQSHQCGKSFIILGIEHLRVEQFRDRFSQGSGFIKNDFFYPGKMLPESVVPHKNAFLSHFAINHFVDERQG